MVWHKEMTPAARQRDRMTYECVVTGFVALVALLYGLA
nr:MAG TPA: hypothetical protein [Caudoviricetes sp.]